MIPFRFPFPLVISFPFCIRSTFLIAFSTRHTTPHHTTGSVTQRRFESTLRSALRTQSNALRPSIFGSGSFPTYRRAPDGLIGSNINNNNNSSSSGNISSDFSGISSSGVSSSVGGGLGRSSMPSQSRGSNSNNSSNNNNNNKGAQLQELILEADENPNSARAQADLLKVRA